MVVASALPSVAAEISLAWNDNSSNETIFKIERAIPNSAYSQIATVGANVTTFTDANAAAGTSYWYRVRASNGSGDSAYTNVITAAAPTAGTNAPPVISNIPDATVAAGTSTAALPFTVSDAETAAGSLVVTGSSSNTTLVPTGAIVFGGSGSNRTVTVTPAASQSGTATITVRVSDGSSTATDTFVLTVTSTPSTAGTQTFANSAAIYFPGTGPATLYPSPINVAGMAGTITNVSVQLTGFNHSWAKDTDVLLVSPTGQKLLLMSDVGWGNSTDQTFTFSDAAGSSMPATSSLVSGTYKPTNYDTTTDAFAAPAPAAPYADALASFNGQNPNGQWSLYVANDDPAKGSFEGGWSITISTNSTSSNTAPVIGNIPNTTTSAGTSTGALAFTVSDAETAAGNLAVSGSSSNTTLVPNGAIVFGGSGSNRTITVTPASGQSGTATITVTVSDGSLTATDSFTVTVDALNTAPTISTIASQTISSGGSTGPLAFTVGDSQTAAGSLVVTRQSSNTTLVPVANVVLGGSGANRTATVSAAAGQSGSATITLTVSDGALTTNTSFAVTVTTTNTAPIISDIPDVAVAMGSSTAALAFTVNDAETSSGNLTVTGTSSNTTLVPNSALSFGGSGSNRTLTVTPAASQSGTATITVKVSDGALTATDTFVVSVNSTAPTEGTQTFANSGAILFSGTGPATPYASAIAVSGMNGTISNVTVQLNGFSHSWAKDTDVLLVSPTGQKLLLMSDAGWGNSTDNTFTFSDSAAGSMPPDSALVSGTYKPTNYDTTSDVFPAPAPAAPYADTLASFNGQNPNGQWLLYVMNDDAAKGELARGWSITITTAGGGATLPAPWNTADIGSPSVTGSAAHSNGVYTVKGAGSLGGSNDSIHFAYQKLSGDGEIKARVCSEQNTRGAARAGVMMRESLSSNSKHATVNVDPDAAFRFERRFATGRSVKSTGGGSGSFPNTWVRLVRSGNTITAYKSANGATWTKVRSENITMASTIYIGVAVASGSSDTLNNSVFDNVVVVP